MPCKVELCRAKTKLGLACKKCVGRWGPYCNIHSPIYEGRSEIKGAGQGLFAKRDIRKNEILTTFKRCPLTQQKNDHTWCNPRGRGCTDGFYDGSQKKKCTAGLFNASKSGKPKKNANITANGSVKAIKNIKKNREIYVSYGADYWKYK